MARSSTSCSPERRIGVGNFLLQTATAMSHATITEELASPREIAEVIRRELAGHNLRVVLLALLAAAAAAILWVALYPISYWLTLLFLTAAKGIDTAVPAEFRPVFFYASAFLLAFAWIDRRLHP